MPLSFDTYLGQMNFMDLVRQLDYDQLMDSCNPVFHKLVNKHQNLWYYLKSLFVLSVQ